MECSLLTQPTILWFIDTNFEPVDRHRTKMSPGNHSIPLAESQDHVVDPTNPRGAFDDGVEHRLYVSRRPADDAEHLGRRRLMLQGLPQLCVALLDLLEQPNVLYGDNSL